MKIVIEVVATNMETGHVAINQKDVELHPNMPRKRAEEHAQHLSSYFKSIERSNKVGPILITRTFTVLV